ncbi:uncharacterized protein LOC129944917 [Eupeodes corollae]|uniref:uncharacterized protein LOC129944917 n=1 Tax=Eupeodes corollae TaxID=290404 RepID=UPI0024905059|nr:uncharacterized protein LOC129944917 [Eupeodes corollae]
MCGTSSSNLLIVGDLNGRVGTAEVTNENINLNTIEYCIKKAAARQNNYDRRGIFKQPWLNNYRRDNFESSKQKYLQLNRKFKSLCREKKVTHYENEAKSLASCKSTRDFWQKPQTINGKVHVINRHLNRETLRVHFNELLNHLPTTNDIVQFAQPTFSNEILESAIEKDEVCTALKRLKDGKAAGADRIPSEFYKYGLDMLINRLTDMYYMDTGVIPKEFKEALIFPIHKKRQYARLWKL